MTGSIYIKQAIIASLCEHPDREKYRTRAFAGDSLTSMADALAGKGVALTKKDFFTPDEAGVYLIDTPGFWRNFKVIRDMLAKQGEYFTAADFLFTFSTAPARALSDSAISNKALDKVFSEDNWRGRYDEMELLWYKFTVPSRRDFTGGDGSRCDSAADVAFPQPFEPHPSWPVAPASPPFEEGSWSAESRDSKLAAVSRKGV